MRSYVLTGTRGGGVFGMEIPSKKQQNPSDRTVNGDDGVDWEAIVDFIGSHAEQLAGYFGIGPGYDPSEGGEVSRQLETLEGTPYWPYVKVYIPWLKVNDYDVWNTGNGVWLDVLPGWSPFYWKYKALVDAGMPMGSAVDRNVVPTNWTRIVSQVTGTITPSGGQSTPPLDPATLTPAQQQWVLTIVLQLAGAGGPAAAAEAQRQVDALPANMRAYVALILQQYLHQAAGTDQGGGTPPKPGDQEAGFGGTAAVVGGVLLLLMATNPNKH